MRIQTVGAGLWLAFAAYSTPLFAGGGAIDHAPIGVMGDHRHRAGEWMFSLRTMQMHMQGNRDGTDSLNPDQVAGYPNPNAPPANLRVVPLKMQMQMHMIGGMWAPTDWLTAMVMGSYVDLEMDHLTYQGMSGTTELGRFRTAASGWGDTRLSALIGPPDPHAAWHVQLGVSLPTGSNTERDRVLTPMNTRPELRLPYAMQLGSGTVDWLLGATGRSHLGGLELGGQVSAVLRESHNDEAYRLGNELQLSTWLAKPWSARWSTAGRLQFKDRGRIDGRDAQIAAPVQTADPNSYGGSEAWLHVSSNHQLGSHRLAIEFGVPVHRNLNGPQLETDWMLTLGYQLAGS